MLRNAPVMLNSAPRNVAWQPQTAINFPKRPAVMAGIWTGASTFDPHVERKGEGEDELHLSSRIVGLIVVRESS